jgi:hypothetical protein
MRNYTGVVVVESPMGMNVTYLDGGRNVSVGDTVSLPPLRSKGSAWKAKVISLESNYSGFYCKEILDVISRKNVMKNIELSYDEKAELREKFSAIVFSNGLNFAETAICSAELIEVLTSFKISDKS